jgi:peptidoglycan/xylan/chitin deacetylase (PgdA/CDA1 family)
MDKPFVSLTFDDGLRNQIERAVPILDRYGLAGTFFLIANTYPVHERPTWRKSEWNSKDVEDLNNMVLRGHEIGSHSVNHKDPQSDPSFDPILEAEQSKQLIETWMGWTGKKQITSFCYPFCKKPDALKSAVKAAKYEQARAGSTGLSYYSPHELIDLFDVDCRQITPNENVGSWIQPKRWHVLMFHGIGDWQDGWAPISVDEFSRQMVELAKHRDSGAVDVVTFKEGADRFGQG